MPLRTSSPRFAVGAAALGSACVTLALLAPALRPGYALHLDHVAVPDPARPQWSALTAPSGLRAWPLDGVAWAWSQVLPAWVFHLWVLVGAVLLASLGAGILLRRWGWIAAFSASVLAAANPYVVERLLLGQPALLLGYAALPWILIASRQRRPLGRIGWVTLASLPAALTPWGSLLAAVSAVAAALLRRRSLREVAGQGAASTALCLPWLIPALMAAHGGADPDGALAFRLADETGVGTFATALIGAGVWSAAAQAVSLTPIAAALLIGAVALLATAGLIVMAGRRREQSVALAGVLLATPAVAAFVSGPGLSWWSGVQRLPGVALFRDTHRMLAPSTFALVILLAAGISALNARVTDGRTSLAMPLGAVLPVSLALVLVPSGPARLHDAYQPVPFPAEWVGAVRSLEPTGNVLSLPWQPLRRAGWAPGTFLDPTAKSLGARGLSSSALTVQRDGGVIVVDEPSSSSTGVLDDTLVQILTGRASDPVTSELLSSSDITSLLVWKDSPGLVPEAPEGWIRTFSGRFFDVWSRGGGATG